MRPVDSQPVRLRVPVACQRRATATTVAGMQQRRRCLPSIRGRCAMRRPTMSVCVVIEVDQQRLSVALCCSGDSGGGTVSATSLAGIYPNALGEGIGRGHWFALIEMAAKFKSA
jgi:hypothetical protein